VVTRVEADPSLAHEVAASVVDPELPMLTLADLGVLRAVHAEGGRVVVELAPTYSGCPAVAEMRADVAAALHAAGFAEVEVRVVLDPPWSTDDITARGRALLAEHGIAPPGPAPLRGRAVPISLGVRIAAPACPQCGSADTELSSAFGSTACKALCRCRACGEPFEHVKAI
jgi:ring-1,2-phenylacetyl-CoA epoxidase subunit PaaD